MIVLYQLNYQKVHYSFWKEKKRQLAHLNLLFTKMFMTYYFQTKVWIRTLIWIHSSHLLNPDLPGSFWIRNKLEYSRQRGGEDDCSLSAELPEGAGPDLPEERERGVQRLQQHQWVGGVHGPEIQRYMDQRYRDTWTRDTEIHGPDIHGHRETGTK